MDVILLNKIQELQTLLDELNTEVGQYIVVSPNEPENVSYWYQEIE